MSSLKYWLWLAGIKDLGPAKTARMIDEFGSPENIYFADEDEYKRFGSLSDRALSSLCAKSTANAEIILENCSQLGVKILTLQDAAYPNRLKHIYDPPAVLYLRGSLPALDEEPFLTVVGTRTSTPYGNEVALRMSYRLAKAGMIIVSGMASGIDGYAHRGAAKAGKPTVAVLGCGVDVCYPAENRDVYDYMLQSGVLISEYPPGTRALGAHFPVRNRILSALSLGTLVVEADADSGALITANCALEQGRDVFCIPGPVTTKNSEGCHNLVKASAAALVTKPEDILREYIPLFPHKLSLTTTKSSKPSDNKTVPVPEPKTLRTAGKTAVKEKPEPRTVDITAVMQKCTPVQQSIVLSIAASALTADEIIAQTGLKAPQVLSELTLLEIEGIIEQKPGKRFILSA